MHLRTSLIGLAYSSVASVLALACSSQGADGDGDTSAENGDGDTSSGSNGDGGQGGVGGANDGTSPLYAFMSNVYAPNGDRVVYVKPFTSLDVDELGLEDAHEYPGVANISAAAGRLLVSSGEASVITAYEIDENLNWREFDEISFGNYTLYDNANFFSQFKVDDHHMYLPFETVKRIVWDPTEFDLVEVMEDSDLELQRGPLFLEHAGNRSGLQYPGDTIVSYFYRDEEWFDFGDVSPIAVYDRLTHQESKVISAPCPGLAVASRDEDGNTYFSPYDYSPMLALYGRGPAPCVVRVDSELDLDESFTTDFTEWTGGLYTNSFRYVRDGWGLGLVFDDEKAGIDFSADEIDPDAFDAIWDEDNWSVWRFDLEKEEAEPYDDVNIPSFGWSYSELDGRSFLLVYGEANTQVFELEADGTAREHLEIEGEATWIKVR